MLINKWHGTGPINPQKDNSKTKVYRGSAGEGSPNKKINRQKMKKERWLNTGFPLSFYVFGDTFFIFILLFFIVRSRTWERTIQDWAFLFEGDKVLTSNAINMLFLIVIAIMVLALVRMVYIIYTKERYENGFLNYIKQRRSGYFEL